MVGDQGNVQGQREPLAGKQEQEIEEDVQDVLGEDQRVQTVALVDGVLVVRLQFIKGNHVEDAEEDEEGIGDQGDDVGQGGHRERHPDRGRDVWAVTGRENGKVNCGVLGGWMGDVMGDIGGKGVEE